MWIAVVVISLLAVVLFAIYWRSRKSHNKAVVQATPSEGIGVKLRKAAEYIPVYGTFVKVAGVVGKPINQFSDKFTDYQIKGLQHVPVAGKYLAMPLQGAKAFADKVNSFIGL